MDESIPGFYYDDSTSSGSGSSPGLLNYLQWGGSTATGLLGALNKSKAATAPAKPTNWAVIAGIGAAVLVVLVLFVSLGRK